MKTFKLFLRALWRIARFFLKIACAAALFAFVLWMLFNFTKVVIYSFIATIVIMIILAVMNKIKDEDELKKESQ